MKQTILIALSIALASTTAAAQPNKSQHPRTGLITELTFEPGTAKLVLDSYGKANAKLNAAVTWAKQNPDGFIVLDGHADKTGPNALGVRLSLERAQAVRSELVTAGTDPDQIVIAAFGADGPKHAAASSSGVRAQA